MRSMLLAAAAGLLGTAIMAQVAAQGLLPPPVRAAPSPPVRCYAYSRGIPWAIPRGENEVDCQRLGRLCTGDNSADTHFVLIPVVLQPPFQRCDATARPVY